MPKAQALHEAKKDYLLQNSNDQLNHPFRWAGFVYYGMDTPLILGKSGGWKCPWIWVFLGAALLGLFFIRRIKNKN